MLIFLSFELKIPGPKNVAKLLNYPGPLSDLLEATENELAHMLHLKAFVLQILYSQNCQKKRLS